MGCRAAGDEGSLREHPPSHRVAAAMRCSSDIDLVPEASTVGTICRCVIGHSAEILLQLRARSAVDGSPMPCSEMGDPVERFRAQDKAEHHEDPPGP